MTPWRRFAVSSYYRLTLPYRCWRAKRGPAPVCVLFYHRVADVQPTPWTITNRQFARQIDWMSRRFDFVSLGEAQRRLRGEAPHQRPAVSVTFDDGYSENCEQALPMLIKRRIPFAYFVATDFIFQAKRFPHDAQRGLTLLPNTVEQIKALADAGATIGAHTRSHLDLGEVENESTLRREVLGSVKELEDVIHKPVRWFAFPFGLHANLNAAAFHLCKEAGLDGVCSAYGGYNFPGEDPFHLQRFHGDPEMPRLKNCLTVDPIKRLRVKRFHYQRLEVASAVGAGARE